MPVVEMSPQLREPVRINLMLSFDLSLKNPQERVDGFVNGVPHPPEAESGNVDLDVVTPYFQEELICEPNQGSTSLSDAAIMKLVKLAQNGDEQAFGELYKFYYPRIMRFALRKLVNPEDAEDVTSEVFFKMLGGIQRFEDIGLPFNGWVFRIARNKVIDHIRPRDSGPATDILKNDPLDTRESRYFERSAGDPFMFEELSWALSKLSPSQREVIKLRFFDDLTVKQTVNSLGKKEDNVKMLQHNAIKKLRELLRHKWDID